jgi:DNA-binding transcriptional regulator YiaG
MSLDIKRMQKLAGILTEGFSPSEESARYTKSSLKSHIKEMILKEMEDDELEEAKKAAEEEIPAEEEMPMDDSEMSMDDEMPADGEEESELSTPEQVQKELMAALRASKKLGDKKLTRQIGNVLTYFTRTQISSDEDMDM